MQLKTITEVKIKSYLQTMREIELTNKKYGKKERERGFLSSDDDERNGHVFAESSEQIFSENSFDFEPRIFVDQADRF